MILTTIAIIWASVAAVFVLGLCMAAAKPVPQSAGWSRECSDLSAPEDSTEEDGEARIRLYCGRSLNLQNGRLSSLESQPVPSLAGQRGGMADATRSDDSERVVSF